MVYLQEFANEFDGISDPELFRDPHPMEFNRPFANGQLGSDFFAGAPGQDQVADFLLPGG
jgi:hypothetical protein